MDYRKYVRRVAAAGAVAAALAASATTTGVYRTAITLAGGTQEIIPDTVAHRFNFSQERGGGKPAYRLEVVKDGAVALSLPTDSIVAIDYAEMSYYEQFAGDWYLVMSPNGEPNAQGIMISQTVAVPYHAVLPAPGTPGYGEYIYCHIDSMPHRFGLRYSADFRLRYSYDAASGSGTVCMVLDDSSPVTAEQYLGDASSYAYASAGSTWYFGVSSQHEGGDTGNRYMYFVSDDIATHQLRGMELPAAWTDADQLDVTHAYRFPQSQQIYWITALDIPYSNAEHDEVGFIDIFASPRLMRNSLSQ